MISQVTVNNKMRQAVTQACLNCDKQCTKCYLLQPTNILYNKCLSSKNFERVLL